MDFVIILVHKGNPFYLKPMLKQVRLLNPKNRICLLGDCSNNQYDFVEHYNINDFQEGVEEFMRIYRHYSPNPYDFEIFCFIRWFVVRNFVRAQNIRNFVCMDSDTLIYCNVNQVFKDFVTYDFTVCGINGPNFSMFNDSSIARLCEYLLYLYKDSEKLKQIQDFYQFYVDHHIDGGFCDMTALEWYQKEISDNVLDIAQPLRGACFDINISDVSSFESENGRKKIYWQNNRPYGRWKKDNSLVRFYGLHFQGRAKYVLYKYCLNEKGNHCMGWRYTLAFLFSIGHIKARILSVKKALRDPDIVIHMLKKKLGILHVK